jgi:hypothetical protein
LVTAAGHRQHRIEAQTGWGGRKFVRDTRNSRVVTIEADIPAPPTRYPTTSANPHHEVAA